MQHIIEDFLNQAGITINGNNPWDIQVHHRQLFDRLMSNTELALGESYMEGWWDCPQLDQFFYRVLKADLDKKIISSPTFWKNKLIHSFYSIIHQVFNYQTYQRALSVGKQHYDIGNDLYQAMLDSKMIYTCGYWEGAGDLDEAQEKKLEMTCNKLDLQPGMKVLDIGCGWGGLAKFMASRYKVSVVGITISKQQVDLGRKLCKGLPVEILFQDYRELINSNVKYDRIVSLGMFEHVGYKNYTAYLKTVAQCLQQDGLFLLHTIGRNKTTHVTNAWINKYIFPNGQIPSIAQIGLAAENIFVVEDWHNFGAYYDKTLMAWQSNVTKHWDTLKNKYDDRFRRMWDFYLFSCAAAFRARRNQLWQIMFSKNGLKGGYRRILYENRTLNQKIRQPATV